MTPKWIIEHIFDDDCERLVASLQKLGVEHKIVSSVFEGKWRDLYDDKDCVITYGSITFGNLIQRESKWVPGHYCTNHNYLCSVYYPHFGNMLLNYEYFMLPFAELLPKKELIYEWAGEDEAVFIRPDSGNKIFTGNVVYRERFEREIELFSIYQPKPECMCLIARPYNIVEEWRFFIVDRRIVGGTSYKKSRHSVDCESTSYRMSDIFDDDAMAHMTALNALDRLGWEPDRAWCMDVCKTKGEHFQVLEIGSFSSAGLYEINTDKLVKEINRVALEEWGEYYE